MQQRRPPLHHKHLNKYTRTLALTFKRPGGKKSLLYAYVEIYIYIYILCIIDVYVTACKSCVQNLVSIVFGTLFFPAQGTIHLCFLLIHVVHVLLVQAIHIHLAFIEKKPLVGVFGWENVQKSRINKYPNDVQGGSPSPVINGLVIP